MSRDALKARVHVEEQLTHQGIGTKRALTQITDTITFEFKKNFKKTLINMILFTTIFLLFLIIQEYREAQGVEKPAEALDYLLSYLMMVDLLIYISASSYGGSAIAADFEKQTGNLLFPKISKDRLIIGRSIGLYLMNAFVVLYYYLLIAITTFIKYDALPKEIWQSLGWALLFTFTVLSFVIFLSSFMKSTAAAVVFAIMLFLIIFSIITQIMWITTTKEPIWIITYYGSIILQSVDMPDPRYTDIPIPISETESLTMRMWLTPAANYALGGMIIYGVISLVLAYFIFKRRQSKG